MTTYFLDMPNIEFEMYSKKEMQLDKKEAELNQLEKDLNRRERSVNRREQELKNVSPQVWKKAKKAKKAKKKAKQTSFNGTDNTTLNLSAKTAGTNESVVVNTAGVPGSDEATSSSIGSIILIVAALLLCATSALFYRKHQN